MSNVHQKAETGTIVRAPRMKPNVTSDDVIESVRGDSSCCAIVTATERFCRDHLRFEPKHVSVDVQTIRVSDPVKRLRYAYLTPRSAQQFIIDYDQGADALAPFSFELRGGLAVSMGSATRTRRVAPGDIPDGASSYVPPPARRARLVANKKAKDGVHSSSTTIERVGGSLPPINRKFRREYGLRAFRG